MVESDAGPVDMTGPNGERNSRTVTSRGKKSAGSHQLCVLKMMRRKGKDDQQLDTSGEIS